MTCLILYFLLLHIKMALQLESCNSGDCNQLQNLEHKILIYESATSCNSRGCNHLQNFQINCRAISNYTQILKKKSGFFILYLILNDFVYRNFTICILIILVLCQLKKKELVNIHLNLHK